MLRTTRSRRSRVFFAYHSVFLRIDVTTGRHVPAVVLCNADGIARIL